MDNIGSEFRLVNLCGWFVVASEAYLSTKCRTSEVQRLDSQWFRGRMLVYRFAMRTDSLLINLCGDICPPNGL